MEQLATAVNSAHSREGFKETRRLIVKTFMERYARERTPGAIDLFEGAFALRRISASS